MKHFYFKSIFLSLLMMVIGSAGALAAEEETIATFKASDYNSGTTGEWTVSNANYATAGGGYYQLTYSDASIVTPAINWSGYSNITITISARKFGGPDTSQGRISVSQGETELTSYSPSGTSIVASSALSISPIDGSITISCPGASSNKGCGVGTIVIKGEKVESTATLDRIELSGDYPQEFFVNDEFSHEGMTVTAYYDDESNKNVTNNSNVTFSGYNMSTAGTQTVTVSYKEGEITKTKTYQITVKNRTLQGISVSAPTTSFNAGDEFTFGGAVTATYDDGTTKDVTSDATFSGYNMSEAEEQTVTVSYTEDGVTKTTTYNITVSAVAAQFVMVDPSEVTIVKGNTYQLRATVIPDEATDKTVTWSSDDTSVATVSEDGVVTAVAAGSAVITVKANGGAEDAKSQCAVTVVDEIVETTATGNLNNTTTGVFAGVEGFTSGAYSISGTLSTAAGNVTVDYAGTSSSYLNNEHIRMYKSGSTLMFTAPEGYELTKIVFTVISGNSANMDADEGTYNAGTWTGTESVVTFTGKDATIRLSAAEVTLKKKVETGALLSIAVDNPKTEFSVGDEFEFGGTVTASYDNEVTKDVTSDATFTGYNLNTAGEQTVTVSYTEGEATQTTSYGITVSEVAVTGITLDKEETTILVGVTKTLKATIEPANATDKTVIWTSSDEDVATVDENGVVTAVAAGTATIMATSNENDEITASCVVTVVAEIDETTVTGNLNNSTTGVFAGEGFTSGTHSASGTLETAVGNVKVEYAGSTNSYLNNTHIRTYSNGTTLKFTAPDGYVLTGIDITFSSGVPGNLKTDPNDTYTMNDENKLGSWTGGTRGAKTVTFIGQKGTSYLTTAEVTLIKAPLSPKLDRIDVEGYTTDFVVGDTYTFDGTATVTYEDGSTKEVTSEVEVHGPDMSTPGEKSANISYEENGLSVTAVISITVREAQTITFRKISSTDELVAGKRYVIVSDNHNVAMGACSDPSSTTSYFNKYEATFSDESVALTEGKANANFLTLGGEEGAWTFATSIEADKYLYFNTPTSGSSGSNYLNLGDDATVLGSQWTISFDDKGNAVIQTNYNKESVDDNHPDRYIRYNSSQPRFACYTGTQQPVQLYVESDLEDVTLTISAVGYATLYYSDRALKVPDGVTAKTYKVVDGKLAESKTYASGSKIPKGEAVVLKGTAGDYTFKVTSTAEPKDADNQLKGSDEAEWTTGGRYYYALQAKSKDGKHGPGMYWMNSTGARFWNGAHKAYMALDEKFAEAQAVGGAKEFYLFDEATTGISGIDAASGDRTETYNLNGQRVNRGYKGVVIKNGKKIVIK